MPHEPPAAEIPAEPRLVVRRLAKSYGATEVLHNVDFVLAAGETLAVLGDSGCGKTTLLRILAGLIRETSGEVVLKGRRMNDVAPKDRGIVYLDQEPLLFEHLTVRDNIAFAPRLQGRPAAETDAAVEEILAAIGLAAHAGKREWQLSGGQKQRVAFARAVLARPQVLLLDEPFSSLDGRTRGAMRDLFQSLSERYALTSLFVTHDVKEALLIGDRFSLMSEGRLRVFSDRATFVRDEETGIPREMNFWREESSES